MAVSAVTADRRLGVVPGRMSVVSDNNASTPRFLDEAIEMQHTAQYTRTPAQVHVANDRVTSWDFPLGGNARFGYNGRDVTKNGGFCTAGIGDSPVCYVNGNSKVLDCCENIIKTL